MRIALSLVFALASLAVLSAALAIAWATFEFWETGPIVTSVAASGLFAAIAAYLPQRNVPAAVFAGVVAGAAVFVGTALVTLMRWEG